MTPRQDPPAPTTALRATWPLGLWLLAAAAGCNFAEGDLTAPPVNSCVFDSECASKHCVANRCVTRGTERPLDITLEVTPKRMPDGSQPFPIAADPFELKGGTAHFSLHLPISVHVSILDSSKQGNERRIDGQVSFRPKLDSRFAAKSTQITTVGSGTKDVPADISVLLLSGVTYDVLVQPMTASRPPYSMQYAVDDASTPEADREPIKLEIDYGTVKWQERKFRVTSPPGGKMTMRALAKATGQPISNSGPVDGSATTLVFQSGDTPYVLELMSTDQPQKASVKNEECRNATPIVPTLTIDAAALTPDKVDPSVLTKDLAKDLPSNLLEPIVYSGGIKPCANQKRSGELPVDLKRTASSSSTNLVNATFETATTAAWNGDSGMFEFCARVLPGDYVVIVTPPLTETCDRFAEKRALTVAADAMTNELPDAVLTLRSAATLAATVTTADGTPITNASVDFVALGTAGVTLSESDATVPLYNRSRQVATNASGEFSISADVGTYDVVIKPPSTSNLGWWVIYDVSVAARSPEFRTRVVLKAPVAVTGTLAYEPGGKVQQKTLAAADVHAYAVLGDDPATTRSVEVGRGQADEDGKVTLLLSPELQKTWNSTP